MTICRMRLPGTWWIDIDRRAWSAPSKLSLKRIQWGYPKTEMNQQAFIRCKWWIRQRMRRCSSRSSILSVVSFLTTSLADHKQHKTIWLISSIESLSTSRRTTVKRKEVRVARSRAKFKKWLSTNWTSCRMQWIFFLGSSRSKAMNKTVLS